MTTSMVVVGIGMAPSAHAIAPPIVPPGPPPGGGGGAPDATEQKSICGVGGVFPNSDFSLQPSADAMLNFSDAWKFSTGFGQKVAVIDTGVAPNPRLRVLDGGGDFVSSSDGLVDCDAHGTLVAGIIAASPSQDDAFAGVAPDAAILSIRQNSGVYSVRGSSSAANDPNSVSVGYGSTQTLARAIVRAVDLGATVINLSEVACAPVGAGMDDADLGRAVRFAFERNVVVVAAAGNFNKQGLCSTQNEIRDPNLPLADAWGTVRTIASPAWFQDYVLTVGALTPEAEPADFSLRGPWVDLAAPGEKITSLSPNGPGVINAFVDQNGALVPINGTSFATPFVSGVVALVRARFPWMSAGQVMDRIKRTARTPEAGPNLATGYGVVDPVAALTYELPPANELPNPDEGHPIAGPPHPDPASARARNIVLAVLGLCAAGAAVALAVVKRTRD
ncbi:type VII secretion-associated serine protease mycosin [Mycobacterium sp. ST-F2]|uniref:type VII secretion-associated serine protease mycosin n=1 Tax=Mycobacterium sp. ST-F2 TaxID=1490484 RepID=UPI00257047EB|nr:type VII secretion-associated serine protease mycosin [Mycobacterium sp. ST-F2]